MKLAFYLLVIMTGLAIILIAPMAGDLIGILFILYVVGSILIYRSFHL